MALLLIGAGGHGRVVADLAKALSQEIVFADDSYPERSFNAEWPIISKTDDVLSHDGPICVTVGDNQGRANLWARLGTTQATAALVHPSAVISLSVELGRGTVVMASSVLNYGARIGFGAILNTASRIDHDCVLGDIVHISPGAILAGGVTVGDNSWIGAGAVIIDKIKIGKNVVVGAGSVVINDVPDGARIAGVPARPI